MTKKIMGGSIDDTQSCLLKYIALFIFIVLSIGIVFTSMKDSNALTSNAYSYIFAVTIPFFFVYYFAILDKKINTIQSYFSILLFVIVICTILYFYTSMSDGPTQMMAYLMNILLFIMVLLALSGVAYLYASYLRTLSGWTGFFANFVFFIPCMIRDFLVYLREEFNMTSNIVLIVFVLEIILILLYFYLPYLLNLILSQRNNIVLFHDAAFLDTKQIIANGTELLNKNPPAGVPQPSFYQNYGISMWIYLNEQPIVNAEEIEIFNYGYGKPRITYYNNPNEPHEKDNLIFYLTNHKVKNCQEGKVTIRIPKQKWNYFVLNYTSNYVDLFMNGVLVKTKKFSNNYPTFSEYDVVSIGSTNGLNGAICNIQFHKYNLTLPQIANSYNFLMNKNPPINNL